MIRGASGDECGNLLGQEYNSQSVEKAPGSDFLLDLLLSIFRMSEFMYRLIKARQR
jgi:hypothetical protein